MSDDAREPFEIPKEMRSIAEASFEQARKTFEKFVTSAQAAAGSIEERNATVRASAKDGNPILSGVTGTWPDHDTIHAKFQTGSGCASLSDRARSVHPDALSFFFDPCSKKALYEKALRVCRGLAR